MATTGTNDVLDNCSHAINNERDDTPDYIEFNTTLTMSNNNDADNTLQLPTIMKTSTNNVVRILKDNYIIFERLIKNNIDQQHIIDYIHNNNWDSREIRKMSANTFVEKISTYLKNVSIKTELNSLYYKLHEIINDDTKYNQYKKAQKYENKEEYEIAEKKSINIDEEIAMKLQQEQEMRINNYVSGSDKLSINTKNNNISELMLPDDTVSALLPIHSQLNQNEANESTAVDCEHDNIKECKAINTIKRILNQFNVINEDKDVTQNMIHDVFNENEYTILDLLNDFHHIKYNHKTDDSDQNFAEIYEYFVDEMDTICKQNQCNHIRRHYNRSKLDNNDNIYENDMHNECTIRIINRIHVYFIHSYDINRFRLDELNKIDEQ
eukprot:147896_1